jgi:DNA modification methylase
VLIEERPLDQVVPYERNPRRNDHAVEAVARSIAEFGFRQPIVVDEAGVVLVGHTRLKAARQLGLASVPVHVAVGLTDAQKRAYRIADNRVGEAAQWDDALLAAELADLRALDFDLSATGFTAADLVDMLEPPAGQREPDAAPPVPAEPVSRLGDVWCCGSHLVVCGDSTQRSTIEAVCAGAPADVVWTDPPYNVDYQGAAGKIANDSMSDVEFRSFLARAFQATAEFMKPGAAIYVAFADGEPGLAFRQAFRDAAFKLAGTLIWRKSMFTLSRSDYQWQHEPILYGWKPGAAHRWFGGRKQTTVALYGADSPFTQLPDGSWRIELGDAVMCVAGDAAVESLVSSVLYHDKPSRSEQHPTMKPVGLIERMLKNNARPGDTVLDPFGGSGSTLIAAERLGMRARLCELDPRYVDVIVRRWEEYSGQRASRLQV